MILDGGMGHLLRRNGVGISGPIGSMERFAGVARANVVSPDVVLDSHLEFLAAGADVITTNTYACVPSAFPDEQEVVQDLIAAAGELAQRARHVAGERGYAQADRISIAGCIPPLHETYRPDRVANYDELSSTYRILVEAIAPYADVLICETMHSSKEAFAAAEAASASGLPVWVSFTIAEEGRAKLRSGEDIAVGVAAVSSVENVQAILMNCSSAEAMTNALPELVRAAPTHTIGVYANGFSEEFLNSIRTQASVDSGAEYDPNLSPDAYAEQASVWSAAGATIIGGCCGVFPEHIAALGPIAGQESVRR